MQKGQNVYEKEAEQMKSAEKKWNGKLINMNYTNEKVEARSGHKEEVRKIWEIKKKWTMLNEEGGWADEIPGGEL